MIFNILSRAFHVTFLLVFFPFFFFFQDPKKFFFFFSGVCSRQRERERESLLPMAVFFPSCVLLFSIDSFP